MKIIRVSSRKIQLEKFCSQEAKNFAEPWEGRQEGLNEEKEESKEGRKEGKEYVCMQLCVLL